MLIERNTAQQQQKMSTSTQNTRKSAERTLSIASIIKSIIPTKGYSLSQSTKDKDKVIKLIRILKLQFIMDFELHIESSIFENHKCYTQVKMFKNGLEYRFNNMSKASLVLNYLNNISANFKCSKISFNPFTSTIRSSSIYAARLSNVKPIELRMNVHNILSNIQKTVLFFKHYIYKLLYLVDQIDTTMFKYLKEKGVIAQLLNEEAEENIQCLVHDLIENKTHGGSLIDKQEIKEFVTNDSLPKYVDKSGFAAIYQDKINIIMEKNEKNYNDSTNLNQYQKINRTKLEILRKYQPQLRQYPYPRVPNEKVGIYSEIVFEGLNQRESVKWTKIFQSSNAILSKAYVSFKFKDADAKNQVFIKKHLIRKQFVGEKAKKNFQDQAKILKHLQSNTSINVAKFYYTKTLEYQTSILIDLYGESSADVYLKDNQKVISLKSKMALISPIAQGLRLLRDSGVAHLDLKFQNVLIGRGLIPKITDFGESLIFDSMTSESNAQFNSGYTLPYTPHQHFSKKRVMKNLKKSTRDTYSFGVMIDFLLTNRHMLPFRRSSQNLVKKLTDTSYLNLVSFTPEKYMNRIPKCVSSLLWTLSLTCLHPDEDKRPNMDIVTIVLKMVEKYVDQVIR